MPLRESEDLRLPYAGESVLGDYLTMLHVEEESDDKQAIKQAWQALQQTPSYVERYQTNTQGVSPFEVFCGSQVDVASQSLAEGAPAV